MTTLADFPDRRPIPDVDPATCHPKLAGQPHAHVLCEEWRRSLEELDRRWDAFTGFLTRRQA